MANRATGVITFANNFETQFQAPLDARLTTPELTQLTDGSIPYVYNGMCVAVTLDEGRAGGSVENNGLYILIDTDAVPGTDIAKWTKLGSGGTTVTGASYSQATGELSLTLSEGGPVTVLINSGTLFEFTGVGNTHWKVNNLSLIHI